MSKYYFLSHNDERCFTKEGVIDEMREREVTELTAHEAKRETGTDYFYCQEYGDIGEVGESCGVLCGGYKPTNGKNGKCKHYRNCYVPTDKTRIFRLKRENK